MSAPLLRPDQAVSNRRPTFAGRPGAVLRSGLAGVAAVLALSLPASPLQAPASAIVGGWREFGPIGRQMVQVGICSAVVLAPDVVLTAGHCATGQVQWSGAGGSVEKAETRDSEVFGGPQPEGALPEIDLALLRIDTPLPDRFTPARLTATAPRPADQVMITGFGEAVPGESASAGQLRSGDVLVAGPLAASRNVLWVERDGRIGACKGDSGGALTKDGLTAAIVTAIAGRCGLRTKAVLLGPQRAWIDGILAHWSRAVEWGD